MCMLSRECGIVKKICFIFLCVKFLMFICFGVCFLTFCYQMDDNFYTCKPTPTAVLFHCQILSRLKYSRRSLIFSHVFVHMQAAQAVNFRFQIWWVFLLWLYENSSTFFRDSVQSICSRRVASAAQVSKSRVGLASQWHKEQSFYPHSWCVLLTQKHTKF